MITKEETKVLQTSLLALRKKKKLLDELRRDVHAPKILSKIKFERHGGITNKVDPSKIIDKTSISQFPCDAITIRINSLKNNKFTAYFNGKEVTRLFGTGTYQHKYTFPKGCLKVCVQYSPSESIYSYTGNMYDNSYTPEEKAFALEYVEDLLYGEY